VCCLVLLCLAWGRRAPVIGQSSEAPLRGKLPQSSNLAVGWRISLKKVPNIIKKCLIFCSNIWSKLFGNISKIFLISGSKFSESLAENMKNGYFNFIQICPCFLHLLLFILEIIMFVTNYGLAEIHRSPLLSRIKKNVFHRNLPNW
jgi:hypothetical protein